MLMLFHLKDVVLFSYFIHSFSVFISKRNRVYRKEISCVGRKKVFQACKFFATVFVVTIACHSVTCVCSSKSSICFIPCFMVLNIRNGLTGTA